MSAGHFTGRPADRSDALLERLLAEARAEREAGSTDPAPEPGGAIAPPPDPDPEPQPLTRADIVGALRGDPADIIAAADDPVALLLDVIGRARPTWQAEAACRGQDPNEWTRLDNHGKWRPTDLLQICGRCPVMAECRAWADELGDVCAVLGGECPSARRARWRAAGRRTAADPMPTSDPEEAPDATT